VSATAHTKVATILLLEQTCRDLADQNEQLRHKFEALQHLRCASCGAADGEIRGRRVVSVRPLCGPCSEALR
jgi:hypothetical protein